MPSNFGLAELKPEGGIRVYLKNGESALIHECADKEEILIGARELNRLLDKERNKSWWDKLKEVH